MNQTNENYLERAAFGAAMIWGAWTLVPVVGACIAAFLIAMNSGIQAMNLPSWAWSTSAAAIVLCLAVTMVMRPPQRGEMIHALRFTALSVGVVLIPLGVLSAVMSQFEPTELMTPAGQIERNLHTAGNGLVTGAVWVCFFALPVLLGLISLLQLFKSKESAPQTREVVDTDLCTKAEVKQ